MNTVFVKSFSDVFKEITEYYPGCLVNYWTWTKDFGDVKCVGILLQKISMINSNKILSPSGKIVYYYINEIQLVK